MRDFLARWFCASWLPAIGWLLLATALAIDPRVWVGLSWFSSYLPIMFWLSVSLASGWTMATVVARPARWVIATFLAGFLAMVCLLYGSGLSPSNHVPRLLLDDLFYLVGPRDLPTATTLGLVIAGGVFGLILGSAQAFLLPWSRTGSIVWITICVAGGMISFGWFSPLDSALKHEMNDRFGMDLPMILRFAVNLVTPPLMLFILGWSVYALITGLALGRLRRRVGRFEARHIADSFN